MYAIKMNLNGVCAYCLCEKHDKSEIIYMKNLQIFK